MFVTSILMHYSSFNWMSYLLHAYQLLIWLTYMWIILDNILLHLIRLYISCMHYQHLCAVF